MIVRVCVHALVSLAASAAWPDKKREPNDRLQTTHRQVSFIDIARRFRDAAESWEKKTDFHLLGGRQGNFQRGGVYAQVGGRLYPEIYRIP